MDFKNHIAFNTESYPDILKYLEENGIKHNRGEIISYLDILESDPHWEGVSCFVKEYNLLCITETVFSKEELRSAEWLSVRSVWHYDYPQPEDDYREITFDGKMCPSCWGGLTQIDDFRFKRPPKWGKRHFCSTNWETDVLFLSGETRSSLESENIPGITYRTVKNKRGTEIYLDIYQLVIANILPEGIVSELSPIKCKNVCDNCGRTRFVQHGRGQFTYHKEIFENVPEIVRSGEVFGEGGHNERLTFISQRIYRMITESKMDKSLEFQPICLI